MTLGNDNDNGTDGQTDGQTVRRNMRPPPREEGRIINNNLAYPVAGRTGTVRAVLLTDRSDLSVQFVEVIEQRDAKGESLHDALSCGSSRNRRTARASLC